jgi:hypothetical protein
MLTPTELKLNRIAQGILSEAEGYLWFESLQDGERSEALHGLAKICQQSHPLSTEVPTAIEQAGLKPTFTACVLIMSAARPDKALDQIIGLPLSEQIKSFRLLLALFSIADKRRRETHCGGDCKHEWHNLPAL